MFIRDGGRTSVIKSVQTSLGHNQRIRLMALKKRYLIIYATLQIIHDSQWYCHFNWTGNTLFPVNDSPTIRPFPFSQWTVNVCDETSTGFWCGCCYSWKNCSTAWLAVRIIISVNLFKFSRCRFYVLWGWIGSPMNFEFHVQYSILILTLTFRSQ